MYGTGGFASPSHDGFALIKTPNLNVRRRWSACHRSALYRAIWVDGIGRPLSCCAWLSCESATACRGVAEGYSAWREQVNRIVHRGKSVLHPRHGLEFLRKRWSHAPSQHDETAFSAGKAVFSLRRIEASADA